MGATYKTRYGADWPADMSDAFIGMTIGKKWQQYKNLGVEFRDPWVPLLDAAKALIPEQYFKVPPWTEEHFHDWVMAPAYPGRGVITWGPASCSKSHDTGLLMLLDWVTDPFDTVIRLGSTDKQSLKSRSWNSVVTFFAALKRNKLGLAVPGRFSKSGYAILNDGDDDSPEAVGEKAGIVGVAVNDSEDSGKLQGAHAKYVRLVIDELATITHHDNIRKAMQNLRVGAVDFRFFALANPASWSDPSCQYCIPEGGISSVTPETGLWKSTRGFLVRHHDGLKCITVVDPSKASEFPFLITREVVAQNLADCDGNRDSSLFWQMVRGFPVPAGSSDPVVLDPLVAQRCGAAEPGPPFDPMSLVDTAAGIDPAWTSGGDKAIRARCWVRRDMFGKAYLDFTGGVTRMPVDATSPKPAVQQLREQAIAAVHRPYEAGFRTTAVDSSGHQGLADDLYVYAGADCLAVDSSRRASELPLRAYATVSGTNAPGAKETVYDRGTEAWCLLAEFCKAGMVRGLPAEVVRALTTRRFAQRHVHGVAIGMMTPLRLEDKQTFKRRSPGRDGRTGGGYGHSPDEADACALAALAVRDRVGLYPFGYIASRVTPDEQPQSAVAPAPPPPDDAYDARPEDDGWLADDDGF